MVSDGINLRITQVTSFLNAYANKEVNNKSTGLKTEVLPAAVPNGNAPLTLQDINFFQDDISSDVWPEKAFNEVRGLAYQKAADRFKEGFDETDNSQIILARFAMKFLFDKEINFKVINAIKSNTELINAIQKVLSGIDDNGNALKRFNNIFKEELVKSSTETTKPYKSSITADSAYNPLDLGRGSTSLPSQGEAIDAQQAPAATPTPVTPDLQASVESATGNQKFVYVSYAIADVPIEPKPTSTPIPETPLAAEAKKYAQTLAAKKYAPKPSAPKQYEPTITKTGIQAGPLEPAQGEKIPFHSSFSEMRHEASRTKQEYATRLTRVSTDKGAGVGKPSSVANNGGSQAAGEITQLGNGIANAQTDLSVLEENKKVLKDKEKHIDSAVSYKKDPRMREFVLGYKLNNGTMLIEEDADGCIMKIRINEMDTDELAKLYSELWKKYNTEYEYCENCSTESAKETIDNLIQGANDKVLCKKAQEETDLAIDAAKSFIREAQQQIIYIRQQVEYLNAREQVINDIKMALDGLNTSFTKLFGADSAMVAAKALLDAMLIANKKEDLEKYINALVLNDKMKETFRALKNSLSLYDNSSVVNGINLVVNKNINNVSPS